LGRNKLLFFILFLILLNIFVCYGEELTSLDIYFLNERNKILTTLKVKDSEIYLPLPLFASTFKVEYKIEDKKISFYSNNKEFFSNSIGSKNCIYNDNSYNLLNPFLQENEIIYVPITSYFRILGYRLYLKDNALYIVNELSDVSFSDGVIKLNFKAKTPVEFNTLTLKSPSRLVLDLQNVVYINNKGELNLKDSNIKNIRFSQFSVAPYVVRLVVEFNNELINPEIVREEGSILLKFPTKEVKKEVKDESKTLDSDTLTKDKVLNKLTDISWTEDDSNLTFMLKFERAFTYTKNILDMPSRIYYDFPETTFTLTNSEILVERSPVKSIRVGKREEDTNMIRVVFDIYASTLVQEETLTNTLKVVFPKNEVKKKFLVFIDPGHGGSDPGAISGNIKEKDLNLNFSLKLSEALKKNGYEVVNLREEDKTISLDDRVSFINRYLNTGNDLLGRSILISIHTNAAVAPEVRGIEILYANDFSAELAKVIANTLGEDFSVRRTIMGKFYVLSRVPIPGVIVETGFLTNEEDRKLLLNEEFQNKLIEKLIQALENYTKGEK